MIPSRPFRRQLSRASAALLLLAAVPAAAQQTINYTDGETNPTPIVITSTTNPTTLDVASGTATQSGDISESGVSGQVDVTGSGELILSGDNSYSGGTTVGTGATLDNASALTGSNQGEGTIAVTLNSGADLINTGGITGGNGSLFAAPGITASGNDVIVNAGTVYGGIAGDVNAEVDAIDLSGGGNTLVLYSTSQISGSVISSSGTLNGGDTLSLGGAANGSFDVSQLGVGQYQGFTNYTKTGSGTWTLTGYVSGTSTGGNNGGGGDGGGIIIIGNGGGDGGGVSITTGGYGGTLLLTADTSTATTPLVTPWTISQGVLAVSSDAALGDPSGTLTLDGGTLQSTAGFYSSRNVVLTANNGTIDPDGNSLQLGGIISGPGSLTLNDSTGTGTLVLSGTNSYAGGTSINAGTLEVGADANLGAATGSSTYAGDLFFNGGELLTNSSDFSTSRSIFINGNATIAATSGTTGTFNGTIVETTQVTLAGAFVRSGSLTVGDGSNNGQISFGAQAVVTGATGSTGTGPDSFGGGSAGGNGGTAIIISPSLVVSNSGTITGGQGGAGYSGYFSQNGGEGGTGVILGTSGSLTNYGSIQGGLGGAGGSGGYGVSGANGGTGIELGANSSLVNYGTINGGLGGTRGTGTVNPSAVNTGGSGGVGVNEGVGGNLVNYGSITGGAPGSPGSDAPQEVSLGGVAVKMAASASLTNFGVITTADGDNDTGPLGAVMVGSNGYLNNSGTITGGSTGSENRFISRVTYAVVTDTGATVVNSGYIAGGPSSQAISSVSDTTIINSGTITAGTGTFGNGVAIDLDGPGSTLVLYSTSQIIGEVDVIGGESGALQLGGTTNGTFDVSNIGPYYNPVVGGEGQFEGFTNFSKTGTSTWTLTYGSTSTGGGGVGPAGSNIAFPTVVTPWTISQGVLSVSSDMDLGDDSGTLTLDGGTLQTTAGFATPRSVVITANNGTIDTGGNRLELDGAISGPGGLTLNDSVGTGTLVLTASNSYAGGTTIDAGTLEVGAEANLGAPSGGITLDGGELLSDGKFSTTRALTVTTSGGTLAAVNGTTATYFGPISGGFLSIGDGTNDGIVIFASTVNYSGNNGFFGSNGTTPIVLNTNATLINFGTLTGGSGGDGANGYTNPLGPLGNGHPYGGNGGNGANAATGDAGATLINYGAITGGAGGTGGNGAEGGGAGSSGLGGTAVTLAADAGLINNGTITGGAGGNGNAGGTGVALGAGGSLVNSGTITGGAGGASGGGGGVYAGNGGTGVTMDINASLTNNNTISGGSATGTGVGAGATGEGVTMTTGDTLINNGSITGSGAGPFSLFGVSQVGAIVGTGSDTVVNRGAIIGTGGADAVYFTGGGNTLELYSTSTITGYVYSNSGTTNGGDTLNLTGATNGTFDVSQIGSGTDQYQGFINYTKTGAGTWTLVNAVGTTGGGLTIVTGGTGGLGGPGATLGSGGYTLLGNGGGDTVTLNLNDASSGTPSVTPWVISQGALAVSQDASLGAESSTLTLDGGTLQTTASFSSTRSVAITANNGSIDTDGNTLTLGGPVSGPGGLTLNDSAGTGELALTGTNTYAGGTTVRAGTLLANGVGSTGTGAVNVLSGGGLGGNGTITPSGVTSGAAVTFAAGSTLNQSAVTAGLGTSTLTFDLANAGATTSVDLLQGAKFAFDLGAGGVSDQVDVIGGTLALNDQGLADFDFTAISGFDGDGAYELFTTDAPGDITGSLGDTTGTVDGYSATLSVVDGQDVTLTLQSTPEPSAWALGALALLAFAGLRQAAPRRK